MSLLFVCASCGATYAAAQPDGLLYFHACAPIVDALTGITTPRLGGRDENISVGRDGRAVGIKAEGGGVKAADSGKPATVAWQQQLAAKAAKEQEQ